MGDDSRRAIFFLPFAYFISTRLSGLAAVASWLMIYPVAIWVSLLAFNREIPALVELEALGLALLATYTLYEVGYMDNDTRTVRLESQPRERLSAANKDYYVRHRWLIIGVRLLIVAAACAGIAWSGRGMRGGLCLFLSGLVVIGLVFVVYNSVRGRINLPLHFLLVVCRFCFPGLVVVNSNPAEYILVMTIAFPILNLLERSGESRYGLPVLATFLEFKEWWRVAYYSLASGAAAALLFFYGSGQAAMVIFGYFLAYRLASLLAVQIAGLQGAAKR